MKKIGLNKILVLLFLASISSSCESLLKQPEEKMKFVVSDKSIFSKYSSFSEKSGITQLDINFRVINFYSDTLNNDTLTFTREDFDDFDRDTIYIIRQYNLKLDEQITLRQLENYLSHNDYSYSNLREHVYWMARVSRGRIKENKNEFGDIKGCWLVTPEGEYVPPLYWSYNMDTYGLSKQKYNVKSNGIKIAEKRYKDNYIEFLLNLDHPFLVDTKNREIVLNTDHEGSRFKTGNKRELHLTVTVRSKIAITRYGRILYYLDFSPFSVLELENTQFPRKNRK